MKIVLATKNEGKLEEFRSMFKDLNIEILSEKEFNVGEIVEDGLTFEENSSIKAKVVSEISGLPAISDDSGLCIDALDGKPGVHTARWFNEFENYNDRCKKMIELVDKKNTNRDAKFISVITLYFPNGEKYIFRGETEGSISHELKGNLGHGYDPIFYSKDLKMNFAEAGTELKNTVSHRGRAFKKLREFLENM
ncbi:RdgB/HAM1 family non-canonical purine NTP pyrophosphatase [Streptobacillus moniliformis]|uniref:RdgB/HAM1 family non-canonical purine NTP pyrophosphatase n=1 Tax=Streptobacillus moniliformis TaxID=34105 RepID=UPI0007E4D797|nr:RdgB/HAM1 family non-canonical purine NTP pyrophosphatase [Streptobacillus moniliformis]